MPGSKVPTFGHNVARPQAVDVGAQHWPAEAPVDVAGTAAPGPRKRLRPAGCRRLPALPACLDKLAPKAVAALRLKRAAAAGRALEAAAPAIRKREPGQRELATLAVAAVAEPVIWAPPIPEPRAVMDLSGCPRGNRARACDSATPAVN